jgi:hypothetical protein
MSRSTCIIDAEMENQQMKKALTAVKLGKSKQLSTGLQLLADAAALKEAEALPPALVERKALQTLYPNLQRQPVLKASTSKKHRPPAFPFEKDCHLNAAPTPPVLLPRADCLLSAAAKPAESTAANLALLTEAQRDIDDALKQCEDSIFEKETLYYGRGAALALAPTDKLIAFFEASAAQRVPVSATTDSLPPAAAGLKVLGDHLSNEQRLFSLSSSSAPAALDLKEVKPHALRLARGAFKQKRQEREDSLKTVPQKAGNGR